MDSEAPFSDLVRAMIRDRLPAHGLDVASLAVDLGVERTTLYRRRRPEIGLAPSTLIRTVRLEHAADLLMTGRPRPDSGRSVRRHRDRPPVGRLRCARRRARASAHRLHLDRDIHPARTGGDRARHPGASDAGHIGSADDDRFTLSLAAGATDAPRTPGFGSSSTHRGRTRRPPASSSGTRWNRRPPSGGRYTTCWAAKSPSSPKALRVRGRTTPHSMSPGSSRACTSSG